MICPKCNQPNAEGNTFCLHCGNRLAAQQAQGVPSRQPQSFPAPQPPQNRPPQNYPPQQYAAYPRGTQGYGVPQPPQKKSNKALIIVLIAVAAVLVAAIGVATAVIVMMNRPQSAEATATAAAVTEAATEQVQEQTDAAVKMPSVSGKKLADAQKELEALGLTVKVEKETSELVPKDCVTRQSISEGDPVDAGGVVTLYVSKGSAYSGEVYNQKVVVTASSGSSYAKLKLYNWEDGEWVKKLECDATVGKGGISKNNSETNTLTPQGSFPLGVVLSASDWNTKMSVYKVTSQTVVCDDTDYPSYYNQIGDRSEFPSGASVDTIGSKLISGSNNALIFIQHNGDGFSSSGVKVGKSSVITLCGCNNKIQPTNGCIDISASNMEKLLGLLDNAENPYIITEVK